MAEKVVGTLVTVVALVAAGFGGIKVVEAMKRKSVDDSFTNACTEAKKAELPIVHADLQKILDIRPENDATDLLQKIGGALRAVPLQDPRTRENLSDDVVSASVEQATELLGLCAQATTGDKVPGIGKFTTDIFGPFPNIKGTIRRLTLASTAEARRGQWDLVKRNMEWSAKLCDMGTEPPFRTLALETTESKIFYYGAMLTMMLESKGSEPSTTFVKNMLKTQLREPRLQRIWGGDLVMRVTEFEKSTGDRLQEEEPVAADREKYVYPPADPWKRRAVLTDVVNSYVQLNHEVVKSKDILGQLDAATKVVKDQTKTLNYNINDFILNEDLMTPLNNGIRTYLVYRSLNEITAYVFDTMRTTRSIPQTLKGSPVDGLKDPFGGQEFRYKPMANGFMIYSVGPNLKDDNGRGKKGWGESEERGNDDLSVRFEG